MKPNMNKLSNCPECGKRISGAAVFCSQCGIKVKGYEQRQKYCYDIDELCEKVMRNAGDSSPMRVTGLNYDQMDALAGAAEDGVESAVRLMAAFYGRGLMVDGEVEIERNDEKTKRYLDMLS